MILFLTLALAVLRINAKVPSKIEFQLGKAGNLKEITVAGDSTCVSSGENGGCDEPNSWNMGTYSPKSVDLCCSTDKAYCLATGEDGKEPCKEYKDWGKVFEVKPVTMCCKPDEDDTEETDGDDTVGTDGDDTEGEDDASKEEDDASKEEDKKKKKKKKMNRDKKKKMKKDKKMNGDKKKLQKKKKRKKKKEKESVESQESPESQASTEDTESPDTESQELTEDTESPDTESQEATESPDTEESGGCNDGGDCSKCTQMSFDKTNYYDLLANEKCGAFDDKCELVVEGNESASAGYLCKNPAEETTALNSFNILQLKDFVIFGFALVGVFSSLFVTYNAFKNFRITQDYNAVTEEEV